MNLTMQDRCNYDLLPNLDALKHYVEMHQPLGNFLTAVLENDLGEAVARADSYNYWLIPIYHVWLYNEAPSAAWGSKEKVAAWLALGTGETK